MAVLNDLLQKIVHCLGWEYKWHMYPPRIQQLAPENFSWGLFEKTC